MDSNKYTKAVRVEGLQKSFKKLSVLKGVSFDVDKGTILALLGPNGAGKTTTINILSTLLKPNAGNAVVNGFDILQNPDKVRASIGLTGQFAAVDEYLTGKENLLLIGRLYRMGKTEVMKRAQKLLEQFELVQASKRPVKTYSGGMRRRLDLAMSLIASPPVIFLDEPTTGLDPRSRLTMWSMIKNLTKEGKSILLTTQHMEEADVLADQIVVIDEGVVIAEGSPSSLKSKIGSDRLELTISNKSSLDKASKALESDNYSIDKENRILSISTEKGVETLKQSLNRLEQNNIYVENISLHRPTLDDVFLSLTGHGTEEKNNNGK